MAILTHDAARGAHAALRDAVVVAQLEQQVKSAGPTSPAGQNAMARLPSAKRRLAHDLHAVGHTLQVAL